MHAAAVLLTVSAILGTALSKSGKCHGQRLYCGSSLNNMGWSDDAIWAGIRKGKQDYPNWLTSGLFPTTLFECDGRTGDDALWFRSTCSENGCHDAGSGHSDYCQ
ncbi:hypothetical protein B0H66DRAFT_595380 [Apodospora peruviana]|uniref:Cyanovirin-N domain-containing protein n=1 Tax=Apodospora peruviana TaxID=516989 RepID=A0AAE0HU16_9PEZI|nr:hypothetical protein B0H66DRAFT_595380 [Apodospora peruviana]